MKEFYPLSINFLQFLFGWQNSCSYLLHVLKFVAFWLKWFTAYLMWFWFLTAFTSFHHWHMECQDHRLLIPTVQCMASDGWNPGSSKYLFFKRCSVPSSTLWASVNLIILQWTRMMCIFAYENIFISLGFFLTLPLLQENFSIYFCICTNNVTAPINLLDPLPRISCFRSPASLKFVSIFVCICPCMWREYVISCMCAETASHPLP